MNRHWPLGASSLTASLLWGLLSCVLGSGASDAWAAAVEPAAQAPSTLLCEVRYASETRQLRQAVSADPYAGQSLDIGGRFRFKAVVLGAADHIEYITLTVHELGQGDAPVIIHQVRYQAPFTAGTQPPALTGWNHVYASYLGRELRYGCALQPVAPAVTKEAVQ